MLIVSISCFAQIKHPDTNFCLENEKVYWQQVYQVPGIKVDSLIQYFQKEVLTNIKQDNFQTIGNTISFEVNDDKVNIKKYGGTTMGSVIFASDYLKYLVVIDFKDEKYRVIVKDIFLDNKLYGIGQDSGDLSEYITKKNKTLFTTNSLANKGLIYFDKHFTEKFERNTNQSLKKDW